MRYARQFTLMLGCRLYLIYQMSGIGKSGEPCEDAAHALRVFVGTHVGEYLLLLLARVPVRPYGSHGDPTRPCSCAPSAISRYQKRISGPLLDRIDIHVEVPRVEYEKLTGKGEAESSATVRQRVLSARAFHRVLTLADAIADLSGAEQIAAPHIAEAPQYRP